MANPVATLIYKRLDNGTPVCFSLYPPTQLPKRTRVPVIVFFHGGGLTVGNRNSWHPAWLQRRANAHGFAFLAPDYRLIPPATGHEILDDIKDLFSFLSKADLSTAIRHSQPNSDEEAFKVNFEIDTDSVVVAGVSAGGLCAYLAAAHCDLPKPRAILSMYGMGGNFFIPHYLLPKDKPFFRGRELLDPADFSDYMYPYPPMANLEETVDSPLAYYPADYRIPGYPANPRMLLARLYLQLGVYLDYYTGCHAPSISETMRRMLTMDSDRSPRADNVSGVDIEERNSMTFAEIIPEEHRVLFPQLRITSDWPPTVLCHGTADTAVPVEESRMLGRSLVNAGIPVKIFEFEGEEHSFDVVANAEDKHGKTFDKIMATLVAWIMD